MVARPRGERVCDEFFKVYFPDQSSRQLRVPPDFGKHFNGTPPRNVKLLDLSGKSWQVEVEEAGNSILFKNGWQKFANDHYLRLGNFLVFRYIGNCVYDVTIFGNNGCVAKESLANQGMVEETLAVQKHSVAVKIKDEPEEDCSFSRPPSNHRSLRNCIKVNLQRSGITKGRCSYEVNRQKARSIGPLTSGLTSDVLEFTTPTNPHFILSFNHATLQQLNIPKRFLIETKIKMEREMVLLGRNGKRWPVGVLACKDGRVVISRGWSKFWRDNNLKVGDQFMFEFVSGGGKGLTNEICVQILRASPQELARPRRNKMKKRLTEL